MAGISQLVGYAGLGAKVHASGQAHWSGRITKSGRKDLRWVLVQAAHSASKHHGHWQRIYAQLARRSGGAKAIAAVARRLLVAVWHVLTKACADRFADPLNVARAFFGLAYDIGVRNLPDGLTALGYTRRQLDRLGIGAELTHMPRGSKTFKLPPSQLAHQDLYQPVGSPRCLVGTMKKLIAYTFLACAYGAGRHDLSQRPFCAAIVLRFRSH